MNTQPAHVRRTYRDRGCFHCHMSPVSLKNVVNAIMTMEFVVQFWHSGEVGLVMPKKLCRTLGSNCDDQLKSLSEFFG